MKINIKRHISDRVSQSIKINRGKLSQAYRMKEKGIPTWSQMLSAAKKI